MEVNHDYYMSIAIKEAQKALGKTFPNPLVGAVIVRNGEVIAKDYHRAAGQDHAERALLNRIQVNENDILYVTLEPCCHQGKTPACTDIILQQGLKKVVIGMLDPNPLVAGKGIEILKSAGVEVICGVKEKECRDLNRPFIKNILHSKAYISLKFAQTLDGYIADVNGHSKWITSEASRELVHLQRRSCDCLIIGAGTVNIDDPSLTTRISGQMSSQSLIVIDPKAIINLSSRCFELNSDKTHYLFSPRRPEKLPDNLKWVQFKGFENFDRQIWSLGFFHALVEGGAHIHAQLLQASVVDRIWSYTAPKILGGARNHLKNMRSLDIDSLANCLNLRLNHVQSFDADIYAEYLLN